MNYGETFGELRASIHSGEKLRASAIMAIASTEDFQPEELERLRSYKESHIKPKASGEPWLGYANPRPWQPKALAAALDALSSGQAGVIRAATGSGKSAVICELSAELLDALDEGQRIVITVPSQDLVWQVREDLDKRLGEGMAGSFFQHEKDISKPVIVACHASLFTGGLGCLECCEELELDVESAVFRTAPEPVAESARVQWTGALFAPDYNPPAFACREPYNHSDFAVYAENGCLAGALVEAGLAVAFWIADECHQTENPRVKSWVDWVAPSDRVGFSATPWLSNRSQAITLFESLIYNHSPQCAIREGSIMAPRIVPFTGSETTEEEAAIAMMRDHLEAHPGSRGVVSERSIGSADEFAALLRERGYKAEAVHSRIPKKERDARIARLESGELHCLVHVSMLSEGVNFPWLEWILFKRSEVSRVRFSQEVGRALRTCGGKKGAWILDLHDLFNRLALDYEAVLSGGVEVNEHQAELRELAAMVNRELRGEQLRLGDDFSPIITGRRANPLEVIRAWLRSTVNYFRLIGAAPSTIEPGYLRDQEQTEFQRAQIAKLLKRKSLAAAAEVLRDDERTILRELCSRARELELTRGDAEDLIHTLKAFSTAEGWPDLEREDL